MGRQIIKHPTKPGFMIWSTITDDWLWKKPITLEQYIAFRRDEEGDRAERDIRDVAKMIERGEKPYFQFTLTHAECEETRKNKGRDTE